MPGFRYHVVTLVGVFLALGVGIIIGSSFVQSAIVDRQTRQLQDLKEQFNRDVVAAQDLNRQYAAFVGALSVRVPNTRVAIVLTGDYPDAARHLRDTLDQAGASVSSITTIDHMFSTRVQVNTTRLAPLLQQNHPGVQVSTSALLHLIALEVARGGADSDLAAMEDARLITYEGDYSHPNDSVILVGGASEENDSRAETVDLPLISEFQALGVKVVAAEPQVADVSYIPALRGHDITTVDNADTDIGRLGVALALKADPGNFGVKPTARSIVPPSVLSDDIRRRAGVQ